MKQQKKSMTAYLLSDTKGYRGRFALAFGLILLELALGFVTPLILSVTIDSVIGGQALNAPRYFAWLIRLLGGVETIRRHMLVMPALLIGFALLSGLMSFVRPCLTWSAVCEITKHLRDRYYAHVQRLPFQYHTAAKTGDLIQRATSDIDTISGFLYGNIPELFRTVFLLLTGFAVMSAISLPVTIACFAMMPVIVVDSMWFVKKIDGCWETVEKCDSWAYTVMQENLTGMRVVRAFGRQRFELEKFNEANEANRGSKIRFQQRLAQLWFSLDLLGGIQLAAVTILGVVLTVRGNITVGQFTALTAYAGIFLSPIQNLGKHLSAISQTRIAVSRVEEIMDVPEEDPVAQGQKFSLKGDIVFDHVSFSYGAAPVLKDLSMRIPGGSTAAILGGTGSGKTTLVSLLQRLNDPVAGEITVGGTPLAKCDKRYLRSRIGMVMQEPFLYSRSIRENIGIQFESIDDEAVERAAKIACVHADIMEFRDGYETILGERGVTLSGGQKQRVAIARAIVKDSDILIFDDALSAVDTGTDESIRAALNARRDGVTTILISHRISTLMEADRIFVLSGGKIAEEGTHEELLDIPNGIYARVFEIQTQKGA